MTYLSKQNLPDNNNNQTYTLTVLGPPPNIMIFSLSVGLDSQDEKSPANF